MHELSVAQSLIRTVLHHLEEKRISRVRRIVIRVGPWSGISADALQFNYELLRGDFTALAAAELTIEEPPVSAICQDCGRTFSGSLLITRCPECQSENFTFSGGDDLVIRYLETE